MLQIELLQFPFLCFYLDNAPLGALCVSDKFASSTVSCPPAFLHACRALAVASVATGFFGGVLTLIGMKCTKIGGSELANARVTFAGAVTYFVSGKRKKSWVSSPPVIDRENGFPEPIGKEMPVLVRNVRKLQTK